MQNQLDLNLTIHVDWPSMSAPQQKNLGWVLSALARQALRPSAPSGGTRNCFPLLASQTRIARAFIAGSAAKGEDTAASDSGHPSPK